MDLHKLTAVEAAEAVRKKEATARELTEAYLARCSIINNKLNSFIHIFEETALRQADAVDEQVKRGDKPLPLAGVPLAVKDDLWCGEAPTTWGVAALKGFCPPYTATAVQKLIDAGAVVLGKTNLDQFGMGSSTVSSFAGPAANPWDTGKIAGDGAAAAVAAGQCLLALSSDTGGSLRIGASHCGLFGLRPTTSLISRHGLNTFASSFAQVGLLARDTGDIYAALNPVTGYDPRDAATAALRDRFNQQDGGPSLEGLRVGFPPAVFALLDDQNRILLEKARERYAASGIEFVEISLPLFREALQSYYIIAMAETSSNLGRFDGIRFGASFEGEDLEERYFKTRGNSLGPEGKRRSIIGAYLLSKDNFERYYRRAQKVWALVKREFITALESCSLIMLPVVTGPAGPVEEAKEFIEAYREDLFCAPVSLSGLPALSVPAGTINTLPVGLQLAGAPFGEAMLLNLASQIVKQIDLPPAGIC